MDITLLNSTIQKHVADGDPFWERWFVYLNGYYESFLAGGGVTENSSGFNLQSWMTLLIPLL